MAIQYLTLSLNSFWPIIPTLSHFLHPYPILSSLIVNDVDVITTNASTSLSYLELVKEDWQMFEKLLRELNSQISIMRRVLYRWAQQLPNYL